jgi:RNA polymerase sigma-70 factor (ECF subfamily)
MERLTPVERAAFVLSEVFDYEYSEIVSILNQSEPSCRQILRKGLRRAIWRSRQFVNVDPRLAALRVEPAFGKILRKLGLSHAL